MEGAWTPAVDGQSLRPWPSRGGSDRSATKEHQAPEPIGISRSRVFGGKVVLRELGKVRVVRGKTVTKSLALSVLGLPASEKQIPQVVENLKSGNKSKGAL